MSLQVHRSHAGIVHLQTISACADHLKKFLTSYSHSHNDSLLFFILFWNNQRSLVCVRNGSRKKERSLC